MEDHISLIDKFFSGTASAEEKRKLDDWLRTTSLSDAELSDYFHNKWLSSGPEIENGTKERMLEHIHKEMDGTQKKRNTFLRIFPWAAVAAIAIFAFIGWHKYEMTVNRTEKEFVVFTEKGQKTNVLLPDGTQVWLNSDSRLSYKADFNVNRRNVRLSGEGYFKVAKDPIHPFQVKTDNYSVEALGTAFNIKAYKEDDTSVTTLFEGKVRIFDDKKYETMLYPSQSVTYYKYNGSFLTDDSDRTFTAGLWRDNELIIPRGTSLEDIAVLLNREYNIGFVFKSENIKKLCFEGIIKDSNLQNVLQLISISANVSYSIDKNIVILDEKK